MVEVTLFSAKGTRKAKIELPTVFDTPYRPDLIKRAVLAEQSRKRQPQGRSLLAGRLVAESGNGPGKGTSKVPRTHGKRTQHGNRGTFINSTIGGHLAHPPRADKNYIEKINKKEKFIALKSAVSSTANKDLIELRGHKIGKIKNFPIVIEDAIDQVNKTQVLYKVLDKLGLSEDLERTKIKSIRSGKGKMRGRKYRRRTGPLLIIGSDSKVINAGRNIPGVEVSTVRHLNVEKLAPGTQAGRLTIWTESALSELNSWTE